MLHKTDGAKRLRDARPRQRGARNVTDYWYRIVPLRSWGGGLEGRPEPLRQSGPRQRAARQVECDTPSDIHRRRHLALTRLKGRLKMKLSADRTHDTRAVLGAGLVATLFILASASFSSLGQPADA